MLATVSTLTKCPVLDVADDDEERARVSVSSVHSPRHLAQTGNTDADGGNVETSKWASVTETNLQTVKFIRGLALLFRVHAIPIKGRKYRDTGSVKPGSEPFLPAALRRPV